MRRILHVSHHAGECALCGRRLAVKIIDIRSSQNVVMDSVSLCRQCSIGIAVYLLSAWGIHLLRSLRNIADGIMLDRMAPEYVVVLHRLAEILDVSIDNKDKEEITHDER